MEHSGETGAGQWHRPNRVHGEDSSATTTPRETSRDLGDTRRTNGWKHDESLGSRCTRRALLRAGAVGIVGSVAGVSGGVGRVGAAARGQNVPGETGTARVRQPDSGTWYETSFERTYEDPVLIVKPVGFNGGHPAHVRLRAVGPEGFVFRIEEWEYLDGGHTAERLFYLVVESGSHTLADGTPIRAGTVGRDEEFATVSFPTAFARRPVVFTQSQTYRGGHEIVTRTRNVSPTGFDVRVQEEEGRDGGHTTERIGYVATLPTIGTRFEVGRTPDAVTDAAYRIAFDGSYDSRHFLADMQTADGPNTAGLRYRNLGRSGVDVFVEEERSADGETNHTSEAVGYLVTTPGELFGDGSPGSPAGYGAGGYGTGAYGT